MDRDITMQEVQMRWCGRMKKGTEDTFSRSNDTYIINF